MEEQMRKYDSNQSDIISCGRYKKNSYIYTEKNTRVKSTNIIENAKIFH
jgi:hypothetical protein